MRATTIAIVLGVLLLIIGIFGAVYIMNGGNLMLLPQKQAGLIISFDSGQTGSIFLNGERLNDNAILTTASFANLRPGEYSVRLVPDDPQLYTYERSVKLQSGSSVTITWSFGDSFDTSSGEITMLEKLSSGPQSDLTVIAIPENAIVRLDGQSKGFTPINLAGLTPGAKTLTVTAPGFIERTTSPALQKGYRTIVETKLASQQVDLSPTTALPDPTATESAQLAGGEPTSPTASPTPAPAPGDPISVGQQLTTPPYVTVLETGTGWLRVRAEANASSAELAKVTVGSKMKYLEETTSGWHKVEVQAGQIGWVSGQYATIQR